MSPSWKLRTFALCFLALSRLAIAFGQTYTLEHPYQLPGTATQTSAAAIPGALLECEGDQCTRGGGGALWVFDGIRGEALWRYGAVADLTVASFDGRSIVIDRADPPGTYSSRWAGKDGYFRAHYVGTIRGNRIDGSVYFNGDSSHPGTWYATIAEAPCSASSACPLNVDQVKQLGQRSRAAGLPRAAALCAKIANVDETADKGGEGSGVRPANSDAICRSPEIRAAMQRVEEKEIHDPTGALLGALACGITGVCGDTEHPENMHPTILQSRPASDGAGYTAHDPGSFLCQGLFARGDVHLTTGKDGDLSSELTKAEMDQVLQQFPNFQENYKVRPLRSGSYLLILIPGITGISQQYSSEFTYP